MVEMHVHGRDLEFVMRVMGVRQPLREFADVMVEHVGQRCDAGAACIVVWIRLPKAQACQVADGFGSIVIPVGRHEHGQLRRELIGHADGDPFHGMGSGCMIFW